MSTLIQLFSTQNENLSFNHSILRKNIHPCLELELVLDEARGPVLGSEGLQEYLAAREIDVADEVLVLDRSFEDEELRGEYLDLSRLLDSLVQGEVVTVELHHEPRVHFPLRTETGSLSLGKLSLSLTIKFNYTTT